MKINVPSLSTYNALIFCRELPHAASSGPYYFDVSSVTNYEPFPMLMASAAIRQFCRARELGAGECQLRYIEDRNFTYACHMGFFQAAGFPYGKAPGEASGSTTYIPVTRLSIQDMKQEYFSVGRYLDIGEIIEEKSLGLAQILSQGNVELRNLLQYIIREAIRNIPEHAEADDVWICGQYWRNRGEAEIAILDEGIGIFNSLTKNRIHRAYIKNNRESLEWAIRPGVSTAFSPSRGQVSRDVWANSGFGLYMISEICRSTGGGMTLASGSDCIRILRNNNSISATNLQGTALGIRIRTTGIDNAQAIIDAAASSGRREANEIQHAFKEASTPSKGLMNRSY